MRPAAVPSVADPRRALPASPARRCDETQAAVAALREEERRLTRLGLAEPLRRCREQLRYWQFLAALFSLQPAPRSGARRAPGSD
jgi:hypothetical protein